MHAETLYEGIMHCISQDVFLPISMAGFFGMGGDDLQRVQPVLGVWIGLNNYGLLEIDAFKLATREDKIGEFFEQGRLKLAAQDHHYSLRVQEMNVFFDGLPPLGPQPPQDIVRDTDAAYIYAMDTYTMPHFQTPETQRAAWDKAENFLGRLMGQPQLPDAFKVLNMALVLHKEAREIYGMKRRIPLGLAEIVRANRRTEASANSEEDSSDSESSDEAW